MRHPLAIASAALLVFAVASGAPPRAGAFAHLWEITELYSNADGSVQFIELHSEAPAETALAETFLRSQASAGELHFPTNLSGSTQDRHLLVATATFAAQPGAVAPDFLMPDSFFEPSGDTIGFWTEGSYFFPAILWNSFSFGGATPLPTDGILALARDPAGTAIAPAPNSPTNFAGEVGSLVPEPASAALLAAGLAALARRAGRARTAPPRRVS
jgi:hypothetical protein